jgi:aminoglycoside-2''-adenylyltransferase
MSMEPWCSPSPEHAARLFAGASVPWWFAGGWAIDLLVGQTRRHSDLDIGCFREHLGGLLESLPDWDVHASAGGNLLPLERGTVLDPALHTLWCRPPNSPCWVLEILLEEMEEQNWVYRRERRIRWPSRDIVAYTTAGLPYLRPEIQLLYKSKAPRRCDHDDFQAAWPLLTFDARSWLASNIATTSPGHAWLSAASAG